MTASAQTAGEDWCSQHRCPAAGCLPRSHNYTQRLRGDVLLAAHQRARREGLNLSEVIRTFVEDYAGGQEDRFVLILERATADFPVATSRLTDISGLSYDWAKQLLAALVAQGYITRVRKGWYACVPGADLREGVSAARAGLRPESAGGGQDRHRLDMDQIRAWYEDEELTMSEIERRTGVPEPTLHRHLAAAGVRRRRGEGGPSPAPLGAEDRFIEELEAATPGRPVAPSRLVTVSGWSRTWVRELLAALVAQGCVTRVRKGWYAYVPGSDLREAIPMAKALANNTAAAKTPPPVAANGREAVITELLERGDLVPASELPAAPVFKAGPDVGCSHENMRIRKGVCPDCKQWVTK